VPRLSGGWEHNYSTKARQVGCANEHSIYYLMFMDLPSVLSNNILGNVEISIVAGWGYLIKVGHR